MTLFLLFFLFQLHFLCYFIHGDDMKKDEIKKIINQIDKKQIIKIIKEINAITMIYYSY